MSLVEVHVELGRVADALDKIVFLLEKLVFPPIPAELKVHQATLNDLHIVTEADIARAAREQADLAERFRVVPGSDAFARELAYWEDEQRSIHGEDWEPPDWAAAFAVARGGGSVRESAGTAGPARERGAGEVPETSAR